MNAWRCRCICALFVSAIVGPGCVGPPHNYNISVGLDLPKVLERGQTVESKCSGWGAEMGRFTSSWYTGTVEVEIKCPLGIEVDPSRLELVMKQGEWHNMAKADITVTVHPSAKLGKQTITVSGKKAGGTGETAVDYEIEVIDVGKPGDPKPPK